MADTTLTADLTGTVWKIVASPGQQVAADAVLLIIESMKMEVPLLAPCSGEVIEILVAEGALVDEDQALLIFRPTP